MVSLEERAIYQSRINEIPKLAAFNNLLLHKPLPQLIPSDNEGEEVYFGIVNAIQSNNKTVFEAYYGKKKKSNPTEELYAPFINDDFLIFSLIVSIMKFGEEKTWIRNIISLRNRSSITITLENLLAENYFSKNNLPEIILMFLQLNNPSLINNNLLNETYKSILENVSLFENRSDFHILCSIRSYDLIIKLKEPSDGNEINLLKEFDSKFRKRVKVLAWLLQTIILIGVFYAGFEIVSRFPTVKKIVDQIGSVLKAFGIVGLSQIGNLSPVFKKKSYEIILTLFGYPGTLIKDK